MNKEEIQTLLKERYVLLSQLEEINQGYDNMADSILTPKIRKELDNIESDRKTATKDTQDKVKELESQIKTATIELGESVKLEGSGHAVFVKGRRSWNTSGLETRMKEEQYSWLENYLEIKDPTCQIRKA